MSVLRNDQILVSDVDQTLAIWHKDHAKPGKGKIKVFDPLSKENVYLKPHKVHIRLLKQHVARGYYVIIWSKASYHWAEAVCKAFDLKEGIHYSLIMSKPEKHIDDCENVVDILGPRVYLKDGE